MSTLQEVLDLVAEADVAVDSAQEILAELMGVPNPDDDAQMNSADTDTEKLSGPHPADVRARLAALAAATK
jgi:hypothetical protein